MRFAQAQRPTTLRILAWSAEELDEEGSKMSDVTPLEGWWIQRTQNRIMFNMGIKGRREFSAGVHPTKRVIQIDSLRSGCRSRKNRLRIHLCNSSFLMMYIIHFYYPFTAHPSPAPRSSFAPSPPSHAALERYAQTMLGAQTFHSDCCADVLLLPYSPIPCRRPPH